MASCVCSWQPEPSVAIENRESWQYIHSKNTFWLQKYLTMLGLKRSERKLKKDRVGNRSLHCQIKIQHGKMHKHSNKKKQFLEWKSSPADHWVLLSRAWGMKGGWLSNHPVKFSEQKVLCIKHSGQDRGQISLSQISRKNRNTAFAHTSGFWKNRNLRNQNPRISWMGYWNIL